LSNKLTGGCLCGGVRYEITGEPFSVSHCHCATCRRSGSSAFVTWVGVAADAGRITQGELKVFASSEDGRRGFCPTCGAQISFAFASDPGRIYFTASTLDEADAVTPGSHDFTTETVRWLHIDDGLPQYDEESPSGGHTMDQ